MRITILALLCLLLCTGCGIGMIYGPYFDPTMNFELVESKGWKLIAPSREWMLSNKRFWPLKYFTSDTINTGTGAVYNHFYATFQLDADNEIAIFVNYPSSFLDSESTCAGAKGNDSEITIMMHRVNVEFDNTSVYFLQGTRKIQGLEYLGRPRWYEGEMIEPTVYDLSPTLVYPYGPDKPRLSTIKYFFFSFEHMTCRDYEDAVFVIDGFYYQGKRLPPLKVRLKYYDYGAVPEYIGPETLPVE